MSHDKLVKAMFAAPLWVFDAPTMSSLVARLGRDLQHVDQLMSPEFSDLFTFLFVSVATLVVITLITPFFIIAMLPVIILLWFIARYYVSPARQLKVR